MRRKLISFTKNLFTIGTIAMLILGILMAALYTIAFIVSGAAAEYIVLLINEYIFPVMFVLNILFCCVGGILYTYLIGDRAFRFDILKK